jgi:hypothetical protein
MTNRVLNDGLKKLDSEMNIRLAMLSSVANAPE